MAGNVSGLNWPVWPDSSSRPITGAYGVIQGGYLHSGIDVAVPSWTTTVYAMEAGYVKAIITLYDNFTSWRIVVGDSAGAGECEGWMYAHINPNRIAFDVGDYVNEGDSLGIVVHWPEAPEQVEHLHLSRIRYFGDSANWANGFFTGWEFIANPMDYLDCSDDIDPPVIEKAMGDQLFAICQNMTHTYFPEGSPISGDVDICSSIYDYYNFYQWKSIPYKIEYKIEGDSSIPWTTTVCFNEPIGTYEDMGGYRQIIYQYDNTCYTQLTVTVRWNPVTLNAAGRQYTSTTVTIPFMSGPVIKVSTLPWIPWSSPWPTISP
jgi:hypothetical protein